jgi:hypothetical protein
MLLREFTVLSNDFDYSDAVAFHDRLNPKLWDNNGTMHDEIRRGLLEIAKDFVEFVGVELDIEDITISGSNAAYSYTKHSDIDLHVVARIPEGSDDLKQLFEAKKNQYNTDYDIKVKGIDVELYIQDASEKHISLGIYSVLNDQWKSTPKKEKPAIDSDDVGEKFKNYRDEIETVLKSNNMAVVKQQWDDIKRMRRAGLEKSGEFGVENIVFKILRNQGWLGKLKDHINDLKSKNLSIENLEFRGIK